MKSFTVVFSLILLLAVPAWSDQYFTENIHVQTSAPEIYLDDTDPGDVSWSIDNDWSGDDEFAIWSGSSSGWPFRIRTGAPDYALVIDGEAGVALGTSVINPDADLHVAGGPLGGQVYLDSTAPGGDWWLDPGPVGLWFVNDTALAYSSPAPVKFNNGAPTNNLVLEGDSGEVGIGTAAPTAKFHVYGSTDAKILVENTSAVVAERKPFWIKNNGKTRFVIENGTDMWTFDNDGPQFNISKMGTGFNEFRVRQNGDGYFRRNSYAVDHVNTSSRAIKEGFKSVDSREMLARVAKLPIAEWSYKAEPGKRHVGPVAEDFREVFGLSDGMHLSMVDTDGVALAAIQGLYEVVKEKDARIEDLQRANERLGERLAAIEALLGARADGDS